MTDEDHGQHWSGRVGMPDDIAAMAVYLLSDEAGFITGAMEGTEPPTDLDKVRRDRLANVHGELKKRDLAGALLLDKLNVRYATDATNMQIWRLHNKVRYCFVATEGQRDRPSCSISAMSPI